MVDLVVEPAVVVRHTSSRPPRSMPLASHQEALTPPLKAQLGKIDASSSVSQHHHFAQDAQYASRGATKGADRELLVVTTHCTSVPFEQHIHNLQMTYRGTLVLMVDISEGNATLTRLSSLEPPLKIVTYSAEKVFSEMPRLDPVQFGDGRFYYQYARLSYLEQMAAEFDHAWLVENDVYLPGDVANALSALHQADESDLVALNIQPVALPSESKISPLNANHVAQAATSPSSASAAGHLPSSSVLGRTRRFASVPWSLLRTGVDPAAPDGESMARICEHSECFMPDCWPWAQPPPCGQCHLPECAANTNIWRSLDMLMRVSSRLATAVAADMREGHGAFAEAAMATTVMRNAPGGWTMRELQNSSGLLGALEIPLDECDEARSDWHECGGAACVTVDSAPVDAQGFDRSFDVQQLVARHLSRPECPSASAWHPAKMCEWEPHDGLALPQLPTPKGWDPTIWDASHNLPPPAPPFIPDASQPASGLSTLASLPAGWIIGIVACIVGLGTVLLLLIFCGWKRSASKRDGSLMADPSQLNPSAAMSAARQRRYQEALGEASVHGLLAQSRPPPPVRDYWL